MPSPEDLPEDPEDLSPVQELNRGLLHCKLILYQLSYQGSPRCQKRLELKLKRYFSVQVMLS